MSRMAFLTRLLAFSQRAAAQLVDDGPRALRARVLLHAVEGLDRHLELVAALVGEDHELAAQRPPTSSVSRPSKRPMPWSWWTTRSPTLQVAEVGEEAARAAAAAARWRWTSSGNTSPSARTRRPASGSSKPAREGAHADLDGRALADGEAVLAQHVPQALGAAGAAQEEHACGPPRRAQVGRPARAGRPRSGARAGEARCRPARVRGRPRARGAAGAAREPRRAAPPRGTSASSGVQGQRVRRGARAPRARARGRPPPPRRPPPARARPRVAAGAGASHGGHGRAGHQAAAARRARRRRRPALDALQERRQLAARRRSARGSARAQARPARSAARRRRRGAGSRGCSSAPVVRWVSGSKRAQALDGVAEELDAHGRVAVGREDVEDAAAARHLAGRGDRVLAAVAAFVERLEQDLRASAPRRRASVNDARLEQVAACSVGRSRPAGEATSARRRPRRAACRAAARRSAASGWRGRPRKGGGPGRREGQHRAREPRPRWASVRRSSAAALDVALARAPPPAAARSVSRSGSEQPRAGRPRPRERRQPRRARRRSRGARPGAAASAATRLRARARSRLADALHEGGGGAPGHELDAHHAAARRLHLVAAHDRRRAPSPRPSPGRRGAAPR